MEKLKIRVNSESESKEAQELFFKLGCFIDYPKKCLNDAVILFLESCGLLTYSSTETYVTDGVEYKEITIQQLRDMVVLKRNDKSDATHVNLVTGSKVLQQGDKNYYWQLGEWHLYPCGVDIKPIKEKEMKEFLVNHNNKWTLQLLDADTEENSFRVAVPSGENVAYKDDDGSIYFTRVEMGYRDVELIWQRYTHPEELPFVDDEPRSLNDTYAEIEQVRQTLNERKSTYGDFTSVANTTGQLMAVILNSKNGQTLPHTHKEALHMICSKIARIANGDINHKDSWHDIQGYAKLIEDLL